MAAPSPRKRTPAKRTTTRTSPAKTPAKRTATTRAAKPSVELEGLDLGGLEREGEVPEPYAFHLDGEQFYIEDPVELDWQEAMLLDPRDGIKQLRIWMGDEQFLRFSRLGLPLWKMVDLQKRIAEHFNMQVQAPGEEPALPPS